jgi:hypothetical protein
MEEEMDSNIIQKRVDDLSAAMVAKGMREPEVQFWLKANDGPTVSLKWKNGIGRNSILGDYKYEFIKGDAATALDDAKAFIAQQLDADQAKLNDFMAALGSVIDIGKQHNIEVEFLNPLVATMKRLSENVITDQRAA